MLRKMILSVLLVGAIFGAAAVGSNAIFTDTASVPANAFTTGSLDISTSPTSAFITFSNMLPGDVVTAPLTVSNGGNVQLRYAVTSTTTENTLAAQLDLTIKSGVTTCTNGGFGTDGTVLYGPADLGSTTGVNVIGNPAQGSHSGDRTLNAAANEVLCFQVSLPSSTNNTFQGLSSTATFTFNAEQVANNP
jgi:predicted ribosomally synthesized peptide with SipW-like signal peptide